MRISLILPLAAAVALAACGSKEEDKSGPVSPEQAAQAMSDLEVPRAGQYKAAIEVLEFDIPGLPAAQKDQMKAMFAGAVTAGHTYCLTQEEAENGAKDMAEKLAQGDCTFNQFNASGNSLQADMVCKDEKGLQGNVKLAGTTNKEGSDMTMEMSQKIPQMPGEGVVNMKMRMVSTRVGDCPAGATS